MGAVLHADDRSLLRRVAVKVMLNQDAASADDAIRFVAEARVTGQLEHPGIVPVYELSEGPDGRMAVSAPTGSEHYSPPQEKESGSSRSLSQTESEDVL